MDLSNKNDKVKQVDATGQVDATSDNRDELNAGKDEVNIGKDDDEGNDSDSGSSNSSSNSSGSSLSLAAVSTDTSNKTPVAKIVHGDDGGDVSDFVDNGGYEGNDRDEGNEIDDDDISARLHLLQILQIHLTRVGAVTRRYTHHFCVETLF